MNRRLPAVLAVVTVVLTLMLAIASLHFAPGAVLQSGTTYSTNFSTPWLDALGIISLALVGVVAFFSVRWSIAALAGVVLINVWMAAQVVGRYRSSGWADGLEVFAYLVPIFYAVGGAVVIAIAWALGRTRRNTPPNGRSVRIDL